MVSMVALYLPWCKHLESFPEVELPLYADNLNFQVMMTTCLRQPCLQIATFGSFVRFRVPASACCWVPLRLYGHF